MTTFNAKYRDTKAFSDKQYRIAEAYGMNMDEPDRFTGRQKAAIWAVGIIASWALVGGIAWLLLRGLFTL